MESLKSFCPKHFLLIQHKGEHQKVYYRVPLPNNLSLQNTRNTSAAYQRLKPFSVMSQKLIRLIYVWGLSVNKVTQFSRHLHFQNSLKLLQFGLLLFYLTVIILSQFC